jgi:dUTP pyrophosphatase
MSCNCVNKIKLDIKVLDQGAILPRYGSSGAAGFDLAIPDNLTLAPYQKELVKLGWACAVPEGFELQIRPRSGMSLKTDINLPNSPGTIDSDYRGEVGVILMNRGPNVLRLMRGDRVAQAVVVPVKRCVFEVVPFLSDTERGDDGFGSTGVNAL